MRAGQSHAAEAGARKARRHEEALIVVSYTKKAISLGPRRSNRVGEVVGDGRRLRVIAIGRIFRNRRLPPVIGNCSTSESPKITGQSFNEVLHWTKRSVSGGWAPFLFFVRVVLPERPKKPRLAGARRWALNRRKNRLLSAVSLCRMVLRGLECRAAPPHRIGEIGR
jgi:hypothetical protein